MLKSLVSIPTHNLGMCTTLVSSLNTLPVKNEAHLSRTPGDLSGQSWMQGTTLCPDLEVQELAPGESNEQE